MVYGVINGKTNAWYASLRNNKGWKVSKVKGIDQRIVQDWFPIK
jgi:hypothetical protein